MRLFAVLALVALTACKAGTTMSGNASGKRGDGKQTAVGTDRDDNPFTARSNNGDDSGTMTEPTSGYTEMTTDVSTDVSTDEDDENDLQAVPPGMVAGMNLVCDYAAETAGPGESLFACAVVDAKRARVDIKPYKQRWSLTNQAGNEVPSRSYPLDDTADQAWVISNAVTRQGVSPSLYLTDSLGTEHQIKTGCGCSHSRP